MSEQIGLYQALEIWNSGKQVFLSYHDGTSKLAEHKEELFVHHKYKGKFTIAITETA